ncbi:MAG: Crp/Fnr family transcriptional regulator [Planctomycetes bacterium]|nr:Crp/Fnr family transcriptional regulator [Planctomycetota bacterium]
MSVDRTSDPPRPSPVLAWLQSLPRKEYESDALVVAHGSDAPMLGYLEDGLVKGVVRPRHGSIRQATVSIVGEGHWLGLECLSDGYNLEYRALTECRLRLVPRDLLLAAGNDAILRAVALDASWVLSRTIHLTYIGRLGLERRVLSRLCDLREATRLPEIRITHEDLASLVGVHRNRLGEALRRFQEQGLLECGYGEILLGDLDALQKAYEASD